MQLLNLLWFCLGLVIGSAVEWVAHRWVLHNFKLRPLSHSHFSIHHRNSRKNDCLDVDYLQFPPTKYTSGLGEIVMLSILAFLVLPVYWENFPLWAGLTTHICLYYYLHRRFHLKPAWGKRWLRWHWDHHMGPDQNTNWGVTNPMFDYIMRTRVKYLDPNSKTGAINNKNNYSTTTSTSTKNSTKEISN